MTTSQTGHLFDVTARPFGIALVSAAIVAWTLISAPVPAATATPCPDTEVIFARGTGEPAGVGEVGQAFVDRLRSRVGGSVGVYGVNYPASEDWPAGIDGVRDAGGHVVAMAAQCPDTKMVLGGYSQGAAVMGFVTSDAVPVGIDPATLPKPLQPEVADHVAAVVLFATPNLRALNFLGEPPLVVGPLYAGKTIQLCVPNDAVCSDGLDFALHNAIAYTNGLVDQGADFAAGRL